MTYLLIGLIGLVGLAGGILSGLFGIGGGSPSCRRMAAGMDVHDDRGQRGCGVNRTAKAAESPSAGGERSGRPAFEPSTNVERVGSVPWTGV